MTLQSSGSTSEAEDVRRLAPWFHNLHLPDGTETAPDHPLGDFPSYKWNEVAAALPDDIAGWRVLDIGCNAGFYSLELARRGASVLAIDHDSHYLQQAEWARERFGIDEAALELRQLGVYDLGEVEEQFDLVLFMGVLYHLRHPLLALDLVVERLRGTLVLQTLCLPEPAEAADIPADVDIDERQRLLQPGWPTMAFVEHQLAGDPTNWWVPSRSAVEAMARSCGLVVKGRPGDEIWLCERG